MNKITTLGSLFDGIGGFPLAAQKNSIQTVWASEIELFPIAVSKQHFPKVKFYGDIRNLHGDSLESVDIITAGSPCQDVSIAGKRAGLSGKKSSLFVEMIRIIKEMREHNAKSKYEEKEIRPRILFWENVPGVFSSNKGQDFRTILEEICRIKDETISIPMPPKNRWCRAGCIVANNFSLAWRVLDSQYFGVAQRRKRVFLIADFGGQCAPKILFEPISLSSNSSQGSQSWQGTSTGIKTSSGKTDKNINNLVKCYDIGMSTLRNPTEFNELSPCVTASCGTGGNNIPAVLPFDTSFCTCPGNHSNPKYGSPCHTLSANAHIPKISINYSDIYCLSSSQSHSQICKNISSTLTAAAGTSGNNKPIITMSQMSYSSYLPSKIASTITSAGGAAGTGSKVLSIKNNIIRKLTPLECERLQGFPDNWTVLIKKEAMSDMEYDFWLKTYQNYKNVMNKSPIKNPTKQKILNLYNKLQCDSSRYKALGNSIAIPCVEFIMKKIKEVVYSYTEKRILRLNYENELTKQAEMAIIGGIIMDETLLSKVIDKIQVSDFYYPYLLKSYETILYLSEIGKPIDFITVLSDLSKDNLHMQNEFKKILLDCAQSTPSLQNIEYYAEIVHKSAISREIEKTLLNIVSNGVNAESVIKDSEILIEKLSQTISCSKKETLKPINEFIENLVDYYSGKTNRIENKCDTGYPKIDSFLKGMSGGNLIILASRPKVGKTAFALSVAENVSETGKKVVFYSQEMQGIELCERILAKKSGISMNKLIDKSLLPQEIEKLKILSSNTKNNIIINDSAGISVQDIRLNCRMIKNLGLIIIDYLQLMRSNSKHDNKNQEIGAISRELKKLATDLDVPILCFSQLNRISNENTRPTSSELRDSGELEQNCNKLMLMWCVKKYGNIKTVGVDVALNRRGNTGVTLLDFCGENMTFSELEEEYTENTQSSLDWRNKIYKKSF